MWWVTWITWASFALNVGLLIFNGWQAKRWFRGLNQLFELRLLQLEICCGTWNMRHWPSAMRALRELRAKQTEDEREVE